jgi:deoxyhypusine synthase
VQVPVFQDRIQEVIVEKNVYIEVEKIVERVVDKLVELKTVEEKIINHETVQERVIEVIKEVPK